MSLLLSLVRHAKSSWDDSSLDDFERPLNARGERDAPKMAQRCLQRNEIPQTLISSPAKRALTTANIFAAAFGIEPRLIRSEPRIYEASAKTLIGLVRAFADTETDVMMFGHNPGFSGLLHTLLREADREALPPEIPTCALARLQSDAPRWTEVKSGGMRLLTYDFPKRG